MDDVTSLHIFLLLHINYPYNLDMWKIEENFIYCGNLRYIKKIIYWFFNQFWYLVCIDFHILSSWFNFLHSLHVLPYLLRRVTWFENFDIYSKIWNLILFLVINLHFLFKWLLSFFNFINNPKNIYNKYDCKGVN